MRKSPIITNINVLLMEAKLDTLVTVPRRPFRELMLNGSALPLTWTTGEFTIFSKEKLEDPSDKSNYVTVDWQCVAHIYTTGARPNEPNFSASSGVIYIVFVHKGTLDSTLMHRKQDVTLVITPTNAQTDRQLPVYTTQSGNDWLAKTEYRQRFQMFKLGGNALEPFEAEYIHEFSLQKMEQVGRTFTDRLEMHYRPLPSSAWQTPRELSGLSGFHNTDPTQFPLKFKFEAVATFNSSKDTATKEVEIDLGFARG
ncbi:hypothetical protein ONZ45_g10633 [Pleurotus djamor]|nr:hypothetical protein ONZ45_g10633 [Pleurotus djamor]